MYLVIRSSLCTLLIVFLFLLPQAELSAKGGRGGMQGGPKRGNNVHRGNPWGNKTPAATQRLYRNLSHGRQLRHDSYIAGERSQPWAKHAMREQYKLDHRRQIANHLRSISDRNGNEQLRDVADQMDLRAQSHYDRQIERIQQKYGLTDPIGNPTEGILDGPPDGSDRLPGDSDNLVDGTDQRLSDVDQKLTGRENALFRQLHNEERKLTQRLEVAEQMRQQAALTGNGELLQSADRLEDWAMNHYDQRMARITDFQQRHGLPDAGQVPPTP